MDDEKKGPAVVLDPAGSQQCDYCSDRADLCLSCTGCMVVPGTDSRGR